jgi:hypothetical protein
LPARSLEVMASGKRLLSPVFAAGLPANKL